MMLIKSLLLKLFFILTAPFIYPIAYLLRWEIRTKEILVDKYLYKPKKYLKWLWFYLNDSEYLDGTFTEYGDGEKYYPKFIWNSKSEFLKSYWFNAIRNNAVNWNNYNAFVIIGKFIRITKHIGDDKNFIQLRQFENKTLPAIQFYLFSKKFFIGFSKSGRLWIELLK